ncbi:hypothetical protein M430DRAFT_264420 [Amorphotheca resinae ATCC 22711]|uniref:Uncharacterized protein n=1 Tax=Amorphotheca resinae ATCC 22711 TaxID=857342 RepID=A0A2T3AWL5_AMORE|nr:hypothetical protein M430DRAFT_264420 [Amorphotheca resinae ATCC 22711]PSS13066.1 hypothetical protein M430DRAFT_264420 [Amorphotheca resinae ATCC 22711]
MTALYERFFSAELHNFGHMKSSENMACSIPMRELNNGVRIPALALAHLRREGYWEWYTKRLSALEAGCRHLDCAS